MLVLVVLILLQLAAVSVAGAQAPAGPAPSDVAADSARVDSIGGPGGRPTRVLPPPRWGDQPRLVMARSLLLPGWGQLHNGAPLKAIAFAGTSGWLVATLVHDNREANRFFALVNAAAEAGDDEAFARWRTEYNARLDDISTHSWYLGAVVIIGMLDAYVDANFRGFDVEFRKDPALPEGPDAVPEVRLLHRWTF